MLNKLWDRFNEILWFISALVVSYNGYRVIMHFYPTDPPVGKSIYYDALDATAIYFLGLIVVYFVLMVSWGFVERFFQNSASNVFIILSEYQRFKVAIAILALLLISWCLTLIAVCNSPGYVFPQ
jgi:hypothetical protein